MLVESFCQLLLQQEIYNFNNINQFINNHQNLIMILIIIIIIK